MTTQKIIDKLENTKVELEISIAFKPNTSIDWVRYAIVKEKVQLLDEIINDLKNLNEETRKDSEEKVCEHDWNTDGKLGYRCVKCGVHPADV